MSDEVEIVEESPLSNIPLVGMAGGPVGEKGYVTARPAKQNYTPEKIENLEDATLQLQQTEVPLTHRFAPGLYIREGILPKGHFIIGHMHKTEHFNFAMSGSATVMMDGVVTFVKAPALIKSAAGVRKIFYIHEDLHWATIHPTNTTDLEELEEELVVHSNTYRQHEVDLLKKAITP